MSAKRTLVQIAQVCALFLALLLAWLLLNQIPASAARPPKNLKTIEEFRAWKRGMIKGKATFEHSGVSYTVLLAPAGRYLASGPSAYLFDVNGQFVDWTPDMGDFYTVKNRLDLSQGQVRDFELEKR